MSLEHLGGSPDKHDVAPFNRLTGATMATHLTLVKPGDAVIGVSASHSHPSVLRAANHVGSRFTDTAGLAAFKEALAAEKKVALVVLTRLAVTYELLPVDAIETIVRLAHEKGALVYVDDAGGARVGPAAFNQPRMLELGVDVGATGLDKYGTVGPRFGLLAGRKDLVERIRAKGFEFGLECRQMLYPAIVRTLEAYSPQRVRDLIASTKQVGAELRPLIGNRLRETPTTVQISADDILQIAMERGDVSKGADRALRGDRSSLHAAAARPQHADGALRRRAPGGSGSPDQVPAAGDAGAVRRSEEVRAGSGRIAEQARNDAAQAGKPAGAAVRHKVI